MQFHLSGPDEPCEPADLLIFTVKYNGLKDAIQAVKNHVGDQTIILSALNGISSESVIGQAYGEEKILYCVAQGMDAVKEGNQLTYDHIGNPMLWRTRTRLDFRKGKKCSGIF